MSGDKEIKLQVLICTYGCEGIRRLASSVHPPVQGVEYLVSWQLPDGECHVPDQLKREDFKIIQSSTKGLSRNRNISIDNADAPICLISDDDIDFDAAGLERVMSVFEENPDLDIATFRYDGGDNKRYPDNVFDLRKPPRDYFVSSVEIAFRAESVRKTGVKFDERFGIGGEFMAGEEDIWMHGMLKRGMTGKFFPITVARHKGESTGVRHGASAEYISTKGAVFRCIYPVSWPLRMMSHAFRCKKTGWKYGKVRYCREWLKGAVKI